MNQIDFQTIIPLLEKNGVQYAGLFGSRARGEARPDSDVDLLIKFKQPIGLFGLVHLENEIAEVLRKKVDLVTEGALSKHVMPYVMKDLKVFYGQR